MAERARSHPLGDRDEGCPAPSERLGRLVYFALVPARLGAGVGRGRIAWPSARDWKSRTPPGVEGSNPSLSAIRARAARTPPAVVIAGVPRSRPYWGKCRNWQTSVT